MSEMSIGDVLTDAIRYWESRRIAYNAILVAIVVAVFILQWPESRSAVSGDLIQHFFILAVLANVAYCAAYVVDVAAVIGIPFDVATVSMDSLWNRRCVRGHSCQVHRCGNV